MLPSLLMTSHTVNYFFHSDLVLISIAISERWTTFRMIMFIIIHKTVIQYIFYKTVIIHSPIPRMNSTCNVYKTVIQHII